MIRSFLSCCVYSGVWSKSWAQCMFWAYDIVCFPDCCFKKWLGKLLPKDIYLTQSIGPVATEHPLYKKIFNYLNMLLSILVTCFSFPQLYLCWRLCKCKYLGGWVWRWFKWVTLTWSESLTSSFEFCVNWFLKALLLLHRNCFYH